MALAKKPFVVLDAEILSSSVWAEAAHVKLVWITLLILCDTEGYVGASVPGIANAAGVTVTQATDAIERLKAPDPYSRTKNDDGRRLEVVERGWRILNFLEHLDRLSTERTRARDRVRRFRERQKKRQVADGNVTVPTGNREQGIGNRELTDKNERSAITPRLPANPLIAGRRPAMESDGHRIIREINALEGDRDPTEILIEAAGWKDRDGRSRSKVRLETMTDDHLIRTLHDLKSILEDAQRKHGTPEASIQRKP